MTLYRLYRIFTPIMLRYIILLISAQLVYAINEKVEENDFWIEQKLDHFNNSETRTWNMASISGFVFIYKHITCARL